MHWTYPDVLALPSRVYDELIDWLRERYPPKTDGETYGN